MRQPFKGLLSLWSRAPQSVVSVALIVVTLGLFSRVFTCEFVNFDDPLYVTGNPHVQSGLTSENVAWAITATETGNWFPLTWLSLQLDASLFGVDAAAYHAVNLTLHIANGVLLFLALSYMTGVVAPSAWVAVLFAIHPLHVESVAWVSERKDVLSTLFWMLTLIAYAHYARRPARGRYAAVFVPFACGLCAKSMLVTLPCTLLLLDCWPLRRFALIPAEASPAQPGGPRFRPTSVTRLILEKLPLFVLSIAFSAITVVAQVGGGAVSSADLLPWPYRFMNAADAYLAYLCKAACPLNLAAVYPHPMRNQAVGVAMVAAALLGAATVWFTRRWRRQPYLAVGWWWYLGTLVPVIGLVQIGAQGIADRYTYVPLIGIFIAGAWWLEELVKMRQVSRRLAGAFCCAAVAAFGACTWNQVGYWKNDLTLWRHSIEVTGPNWQACHCLGDALLWRGSPREALPYLAEVVKLAPDLDAGHVSLGTALMMLGDTPAALVELEYAVRLNRQNADAHQNLALLLEADGRSGEAIGHLRQALEVHPGLWKTHLLLAELLKRQGQFEEAERHLRRTLTINPQALEDIRRPLVLSDGRDKNPDL
jgi:tetratricopeptide (TPR) repeat protein